MIYFIDRVYDVNISNAVHANQKMMSLVMTHESDVGNDVTKRCILVKYLPSTNLTTWLSLWTKSTPIFRIKLNSLNFYLPTNCYGSILLQSTIQRRSYSIGRSTACGPQQTRIVQ